MKRINISEHAMLRYLERILEVDVEALRNKLRQDIAELAQTGARTVTTGGATFVLDRTPSGDVCVVTVITEQMRRNTHLRRNGRKKAVARSV